MLVAYSRWTARTVQRSLLPYGAVPVLTHVPLFVSSHDELPHKIANIWPAATGGMGDGGASGAGGGGDGDGGGGGGRYGGRGERICWPQMTKPPPVGAPEPSEYHVIVAP